MSGETTATQPEDVTRLVAERLNAAVAALYEPGAVLPTQPTGPRRGREAVRAIYQQMVDAGVSFAIETPLPPGAKGDTPLGARLQRRGSSCHCPLNCQPAYSAACPLTISR